MIKIEQDRLEKIILDVCEQEGIEISTIIWSFIPFEGEWGVSTSFFQAAADEIRSGKKTGLSVPQRAQQMAVTVSESMVDLDKISHIEAVNGYLNMFKYREMPPI